MTATLSRAVLAEPLDPFAMEISARRIATLRPVEVEVRAMNEDRLAILLRPGPPLTERDWADVAALEKMENGRG